MLFRSREWKSCDSVEQSRTLRFRRSFGCPRSLGSHHDFFSIQIAALLWPTIAGLRDSGAVEDQLIESASVSVWIVLDHSVIAVLTGMSLVNAGVSVMALGTDPRFDLRKSYWLVAGIAGVDPEVASVGSEIGRAHV